MHDPLLVGLFEGFRNLTCDGQRLVDTKRAKRDAVGQRRSLDQLQYEGVHICRVLEAVDRRDVRMVERGEHLRFPLEARHPIAIEGNGSGQDLQRNVASELAVACAIDLTHPARAENRDDVVRPEPGAGREKHSGGLCLRR